jgi:sulfofructose kinase
MDKIIDILGLGYTAVDELLYVDAYPPEDAKTQVRGRQQQCGGLTATALVAAKRLGCHCAYAGTLGLDEHSNFVLQRFSEEGIDLTHTRCRPGVYPVRSTIIVDRLRHSRTIYYDLEGVIGADSSWPSANVIRSAKVLLVDNCGVEGMIRACQIAREAKIPIVADFERADDPLFPRLLSMVDHLILSCDFALKVTGEQEPGLAACSLGIHGRRVAVVTCGKEGCWFVSDQEPDKPMHQPALPIDTLDTTGCGDVFHGAYAAALVHGYDVPNALEFASVAAGLKAAGCGGQSGIPTRAAVEARISQQIKY